VSWTWPRRKARELRLRLDKASKVEFALNLCKLAAIVYQAYFALVLPVQRYAPERIPDRMQLGLWHVLFLLIAGLYVTVSSLLPKDLFVRSKWLREDVRRAQSIGVAGSRLTRCIADGECRPDQFLQITQGLLVAIQSEVEALVVDTEGIYVNASLILEDFDPGYLVVANRANLDRPNNVRYRREQLLAWTAMQQGRWAYEPNYTGQAAKPYKSIIAFPILIGSGNGNRAMGAVSIDSERPNHFDGLVERLETKMIPHLTLLSLTLTTRDAANRRARR
jgi:hypothetical protein